MTNLVYLPRLSLQLNHFKTIVNAMTLKNISIVSMEGIDIAVPVGKQIKVDLDRNVALLDGRHFDIKDDEFKIIYSN